MDSAVKIHTVMIIYVSECSVNELGYEEHIYTYILHAATHVTLGSHVHANVILGFMFLKGMMMTSCKSKHVVWVQNNIFNVCCIRRKYKYTAAYVSNELLSYW
jgi:hypothetical protein